MGELYGKTFGHQGADSTLLSEAQSRLWPPPGLAPREGDPFKVFGPIQAGKRSGHTINPTSSIPPGPWALSAMEGKPQKRWPWASCAPALFRIKVNTQKSAVFLHTGNKQPELKA